MKISTDEFLLRNKYIPVPFWAMNPLTWQKYVKELSTEDRRVLRYYPLNGLMPIPKAHAIAYA
jgi:hypothetical protein